MQLLTSGAFFDCPVIVNAADKPLAPSMLVHYFLELDLNDSRFVSWAKRKMSVFIVFNSVYT